MRFVLRPTYLARGASDGRGGWGRVRVGGGGGGGKDWREGTAEHRAHAGVAERLGTGGAHVFVHDHQITREGAASKRRVVPGGGESRVRKVGRRGRREERVRVVEREQARGGPPLGRGAGERARVLDHGAWDRQRLVVTARGPTGAPGHMLHGSQLPPSSVQHGVWSKVIETSTARRRRSSVLSRTAQCRTSVRARHPVVRPGTRYL